MGKYEICFSTVKYAIILGPVYMKRFKNGRGMKKLCKASHYVGNKAKGRISKRVFQENKARQIFRKTNISYLLLQKHVRVRIRG